MANNQFEWVRQDEQSETTEPPSQTVNSNFVVKFLQENKVLIGLLIFILSVGAISSTSKKVQKTKQAPVTPLTAYVSMWPVRKGDLIETSLLKAVALSPKGLTKKQKLQLFDAEQFNVSDLKLTAKKDIAPNVPLFWNELSLARETAPENNIKPQIFYGVSPER